MAPKALNVKRLSLNPEAFRSPTTATAEETEHREAWGADEPLFQPGGSPTRLDAFDESDEATCAPVSLSVVRRRPVDLPSGIYSLVGVANRCDSVEISPCLVKAAYNKSWTIEPTSADSLLEQSQQIVPLFYTLADTRQPIGFLRQNVIDALRKDSVNVTRYHGLQCWEWLFSDSATPTLDSTPSTDLLAVGLSPALREQGKDEITAQFDRIIRNWKESRTFLDELSGWRDERYAIYGPKAISQPTSAVCHLPGGNIIFEIERAACSLFGFATFGVHLTAYHQDPGTGGLVVWVAKRSPDKQTWPGALDNTVAGGITASDSPFESILRECSEEASLSPAFVRQRIRSAGILSYTYFNAGGWLQPELQYIYDLPLDAPKGDLTPGLWPQTNADDGEVAQFECLPVQELIPKLLAGEFKPNCALVLLDFLIRHGYVTAESDVEFIALCTRLRKQPVLPCPPTRKQDRTSGAKQLPMALPGLSQIDNAKLALNLKTLRRHDPSIIEILDSSSYVVLYRHADGAWTKTGVEGTLFLFRRRSTPLYGFFVLNRNGVDNVSESLDDEESIETTPQFIIVQSSKTDAVHGIWVFEPEHRERIGQRMLELARSSAAEPQQSASKATGQTISLNALFGTLPDSQPEKAESIQSRNAPDASKLPTGLSLLDTMFQSAAKPSAPAQPDLQADSRALMALLGAAPAPSAPSISPGQPVKPARRHVSNGHARPPSVPNNQRPTEKPTVAPRQSKASTSAELVQSVVQQHADKDSLTSGPVLPKKEYIQALLSLIYTEPSFTDELYSRYVDWRKTA
ncbi:uncharacterized protein L969DRAFT_44102 [Mixia osmundae IAM 14324]|uniref:Nudix hydrolase domain-containing protein n=1 Tax=Mixia osmundae (strain CBS 9802 / IAM 14324 / JCM 22182 / KY 12970) TaxID=764103 RepID=G7DZX0_MIXOS|nr:uncharacterized protein L969DRAFT_44102 [Mixia osmundae IAM 14324]KEI42122.1 hypothetical protein L969DRAFT_44102 [Mixia osmundae IAM 14324]GAA96130.1 hypothetical protein E5Q_02791 [Mixia osmundae IAM 14324]